MQLKDVDSLRPIYFVPEDDLVGEVIVPCLSLATGYDCMIGYFHSNSLREIAPGLAEFLHRSNGKMRLLVSPYISEDDQRAIADGHSQPEELLEKVLEELYGSSLIDAGALVAYTLRCLSYLIAVERIEIKVALMREGLFHPKVRLFFDGVACVAVHGSGNATRPGQTTNFEQFMVTPSWKSADNAFVVTKYMSTFNSAWTDQKRSLMRVLNFPQALAQRLVQDWKPDHPPTARDFFDAHEQEEPVGRRIRERPGDYKSQDSFSIPTDLVYKSGPFAHQGSAVGAWENAGRRGILEMATGSGKTATALIAARRLYDEQSPLLIVIAAPYRLLVTQWADEAARFGLKPILPGILNDRKQKLGKVRETVRNLEYEVSRVECMIITHDLLCDREFQQELARFSGAGLLVGDEVHHLGAASFVKSPPETFAFRLGLSATPLRQYDEEGTDSLLSYFGDVVFEFTLRDAIGVCLVPYEYYVHLVHLTEPEMERWLELTQKLRAKGWMLEERKKSGGPLPPDIQILLNQRRKVIDTADAKLGALRDQLGIHDPRSVKHTLVYCTDKDPQQLLDVNRLLMDDLGLRIHQITQEESGNVILTASLIKSFASGDGIQVITAKRVLDEGVNIPEVTTAYILASTSVERQWVQRRGRVLRQCGRLNKERAYIHDFLVLPPVSASWEDTKAVIKGELNRIMEFGELALNQFAPGGPMDTVGPLVDEYLMKHGEHQELAVENG